jgi:hypothetical protein
MSPQKLNHWDCRSSEFSYIDVNTGNVGVSTSYWHVKTAFICDPVYINGLP